MTEAFQSSPLAFQDDAFQMGPVTPPVGTTVIILVDGEDQTADVVFATARFESFVNGRSGSCYIRVRDEDRTKSFMIGMSIALIINGFVTWRGFVSMQKRVYVAPALNVTDFGLARFIDLEGVDINILFERRIVFNQSDPVNVYGTLFPAGTEDHDAIVDLLANFLDLSGDGVNTSAYVEHVGTLDPAQPSRPWSGGFTWGEAMTSIGMIPGAIFYIEPMGPNFVYTDPDTLSAPFGLSDVPDGISAKGYREMEILRDGSNLANDVLCWGIGYGSNAPVFARVQDATSITDHGRWQFAKRVNGVFEQATIDRIADSILNGSPDNFRGQKDDRVAVIVTTFEPGLLPAQKVDFTSNVFGFNDVLPIRKMEVTFPGPNTPEYRLTLSHEIDAPWSFVDAFLFDLPTIVFPPFPPFPQPPGPFGCQCGITDSFTREVPGPLDLGTSDSSLAWRVTKAGATQPTDVSVDGSAAVVTITTPANVTTGQTVFGFLPLGHLPGAWTMRCSFTLAEAPVDDHEIVIRAAFLSIIAASAGDGTSEISVRGGSPVAIDSSFWVAGGTYTLDLSVDGTNAQGSVTGPGGGKTATSSAFDITEMDYNNNAVLLVGLEQNPSSPTADTKTVYINSLDLDFANVCTYGIYDNFDRTITTNSWGIASSGASWSKHGSGTAAVIPGAGLFTLTAAGAGGHLTPNSGPWNTASGFTMTCQLKVDVLGSRLFDVITAGTPFLEMTVDTDLGSNGFVAVYTDDDFQETIKTDFAVDTWYWIKWQFITGDVLRLKVWPVGEDEPASWLASASAATAVPISGALDFTFGRGSGASTQWALAHLDFDYTGEPCYTALSCVDAIDNFTRVVASGLGTSPINNATYTGAGGASVDGVEAIIPGGEVAVLPLAGYLHMPVEILIKQRMQFVPGQFNGAGDRVNGWVLVHRATGDGLFGGAAAGFRTFIDNDLGVSTTLGGKRNPVIGSHLNDDLLLSIGALGAMDVFWMRIRIEPAQTSGKVWREGTPEPPWSVFPGGINSTFGDPTDDGVEAIFLANTGPSVSTWYIDSISLQTCTTTTYGPASGQPSPSTPQGRLCETPTRLSPTQFATSTPFVPGSTEVYVNGLRQRGGIAREYTEDTGNQSFTFNDPLLGDAIVWVCYYVATTTVGI